MENKSIEIENIVEDVISNFNITESVEWIRKNDFKRVSHFISHLKSLLIYFMSYS